MAKLPAVGGHPGLGGSPSASHIYTPPSFSNEANPSTTTCTTHHKTELCAGEVDLARFPVTVYYSVYPGPLAYAGSKGCHVYCRFLEHGSCVSANHLGSYLLVT